MADFFGHIFGLTGKLIAAAIFLIAAAIVARYGLMGDLGHALIALILLPVRLVAFLIDIGGEAIHAVFNSSGQAAPPATTVP